MRPEPRTVITRSTLAARAAHALTVKHSRLLAQAAAADLPEAALAFVAEVADPAATHNCWACRIGAAYRFNDDNEPAGTQAARSSPRSTARAWTRSWPW